MSEYTYSYSLSSDFGGNINESKLHTEIVADGGIAPTLLRVDRVGDTIDTIFDASLSGGEQTTLDTVISNHDITVASKYSSMIKATPRVESTSNTTYSRKDVILYEGSDSSGIIQKINGVGYMDIGVTNFSIKIYDKTNGLTIAENTFSDTTETVFNLTPINNIPTSQAILECMVKKTGGTNDKKAYIESFEFYI